MSVISSRKSLSTSILKSTPNREDSLRKSRINVRFKFNELSSVRNILKELEDNPSAKSYQNLIYKLSQCQLEEPELKQIVQESIDSIPLIQKDYILFVQTLLSIKWIKRDEETIKLYHTFIINLLTAKSDFLVLCLSKIVGCFIPEDNDISLWRNGKPTEELSVKLELVHKLIKNLLEVIPMIPVSLRKQMRLEFPYYKQPNFKIVAYIYNLLRVLEYYPNFTNDILELIFDNIMLIDMNVTRTQIEDSEELDDDESSDQEEDSSDEKMKLPLAETLDMCMEIFLEYFHTKLKDGSTTSKNDQDQIIRTIFHYFDEKVLKTHNTKHVHFIFFFISSFRKSFINEFMNFLWSKIIDRNQSSTIRQTAIGYLSSFLARARFLPIETLKAYLKHLSKWAHDYLKICDYNRNRNPKAHVVFYAICQAIFYIIAFRSRDLTITDNNLKFLVSLELSPIVKHPLNPLNVCLSAIATIFDNITTKYQIVYCHTILVKNASKKLTTVFSNDHYKPEDVLESVFPFDPYLLKKSGKRIVPLYIEYEANEDETCTESQNSPRGQKRTRNESTSCDFEDFIIRESKIQKTH